MAADKLDANFIYNPYHIYWDPIGPPWEYPEVFDQGSQQQLMLIRLHLHRDVLAAQAKAADAAIALLAKTRS